MAVKKATEKSSAESNDKSFDYSVFDIVIEKHAKDVSEKVCDDVKEILGMPVSCSYESIEKVEAAENIAKVILERAIGKIAYHFD